MSSEIKSCYFYSENKQYLSVFLPDKQEVCVGRCPETEIVDTVCSRRQLRLLANYAKKEVLVEVLGKRCSSVNNKKLQQGEKIVSHHNDCIELLDGKYPYKIEFNPHPSNSVPNSDNLENKKRVHSPNSINETELNDKVKRARNDDIVSKPNTSNGSEIKDSSGDLSSIIKVSQDDKIQNKDGIWEHFNGQILHVYTPPGCEGRAKIAAYDMDGTLITTKSGKTFPVDNNDWQLLYPDVPGKLKKLFSDGCKIVIFSNQSGISKGKVKLEDFKIKVEKIIKKLGVPVQAFISLGDTIFRKPRIGMWEFLVKNKNNDVPVDMNNSFYVGDAAGRPVGGSKKKKDHSLGDRLFALNLNLIFHTPEEHFLGRSKETYNSPSFCPKSAVKNTVLCDSNVQLTSNNQELIVMVGSPGSGKSHFVKSKLPSYLWVNRDMLGSWQKCVKRVEEGLKEGKSVVVDNTNPDSTSRNRYIEIAKKLNISVRCFMMDLTTEHVKHNSIFRTLTDSTHTVISNMIIHTYAKNFVMPKLEEGFTEIVKIKFVPDFKTEKERQLYEMFLLEN